MLTTPPVKKIDLVFPLGMEVSARNLKGVTVKDALDAIHKVYKKKVGLYKIRDNHKLIYDSTGRRRNGGSIFTRVRVGPGRVVDQSQSASGKEPHERYVDRWR